MFETDHLAQFKACFPAPLPCPAKNEQEGKSPAAWFKSLGQINPETNVGDLPKFTNRTLLLEVAKNSSVGTLKLCISIFAWGGMNPANGKRLFALPTPPWVQIAEQVRAGKLSRSEAYNEFARLKSSKKLSGVGPAYFTKLLYFLAPRTNGARPIGYIMDQWLGCSVNLLTGCRYLYD